VTPSTSVTSRSNPSRAPAVCATAIALALINIGAATTIVSLMGSRGVGPLWLGLALVAIGVAAAVGAVLLWRAYLTALRQR
jgi:hypothetical protein